MRGKRLQPALAKDPATEIIAENPWYVEDQFAVQLGNPAFRAAVENRWRFFADAIDAWSRCSGQAPRHILDAGCGDGINLGFLSRLVRDRGWNAELVGADYNPLRISRAKTATASLLRTSLTALGTGNDAFDIVLCNHVLEHVPDDRAAFRELRRVLRPGGLLLVGVPNEGSPLGVLRNHVLQRSVLRTTDHVNMYTHRRLRERLGAAGLATQCIYGEGFFLPHTAMHAVVNGLPAVRRSLAAVTRLLPWCAAGLLAVATRPKLDGHVRD